MMDSNKFFNTDGPTGNTGPVGVRGMGPEEGYYRERLIELLRMAAESVEWRGHIDQWIADELEHFKEKISKFVED